jgi:hypothetical protein
VVVVVVLLREDDVEEDGEGAFLRERGERESGRRRKRKCKII